MAIRSLFVVMTAMACSMPLAAQEIDSKAEDTVAPDDRTERRERRRGRWRERMEAMAAATPEERREMRLDWMVERVARNYELTDDQKKVVREELRKVAAERRELMGADAEKLDELRGELREQWIDRRGQGGSFQGDGRRGDPQMRETRRRMRALQEAHPMEWENTLERIEKLLPPEQVELGRKRRSERRARRSERLERRRQFREEGRDGRGRGFVQFRAQQVPAEPAPATPQPDEWEQYTRDIIAKYGFDAGQVNAARSILKDVQTRAKTLERARAPQPATEGADVVTSPGAISPTLGDPLQPLFEELQRRLEQLATERQRRQAASQL